jgi:cyclopropane fatty-acyl-phospholipid synthase-like methyltransferase
MDLNYYNTKESVQEYIKLAEGFSGEKHISKLATYLSEGSSLLEIGSGPGTDFEILSKKYQVTGSDYSEEFINHLQSRFPNRSFLRLNAVDLNTKQTFDAIYSNKVLHHLKDDELKSSVERQFYILQNDGILCHSFWKGEGSEVFKGMFVNYQNEDSLNDFFSPYFDILTMDSYAEFEKGDSIVLFAKRK